MFVLEVKAARRGLTDITAEVRQWVSQQSITLGMLTLFCRHTSASLLIQENAAPAVRRDMEKFFDQLAPEAPGRYEHDDEGPDDMPAHLKTALTQVQLSVPVMDSRLKLYTAASVVGVATTGGTFCTNSCKPLTGNLMMNKESSQALTCGMPHRNTHTLRTIQGSHALNTCSDV